MLASYKLSNRCVSRILPRRVCKGQWHGGVVQLKECPHLFGGKNVRNSVIYDQTGQHQCRNNVVKFYIIYVGKTPKRTEKFKYNTLRRLNDSIQEWSLHDKKKTCDDFCCLLFKRPIWSKKKEECGSLSQSIYHISSAWTLTSRWIFSNINTC